MVEQGLGAVAGGESEVRFESGGGVEVEWVRVRREEQTEVEGVGGGFVDGDWERRSCGFWGRWFGHFENCVCVMWWGMVE